MKDLIDVMVFIVLISVSAHLAVRLHYYRKRTKLLMDAIIDLRVALNSCYEERDSLRRRLELCNRGG